MPRDFGQLAWDDVLADDCRQLVRLAVREDLGRGFDWTTVALIPEDAPGRAAIVARQAGIVAGLPAAAVVLDEMEVSADWRPLVADGDVIAAGTTLAELAGNARDLLTAERIVLNLLGRLCGVATLTRRYVDAVAGTRARVYDTRKTTPGWRRLEKYAVRCGGGCNHRTGLCDAILIKDNHLFLAAHQAAPLSPGDAVRRAREFLRACAGERGLAEDLLIEIEVDTWEQFLDALAAGPDLILLDNMTPAQLRAAAEHRNQIGSPVELEASGGINLSTIRAVAESGVERISVGALTHGAVSLDVGLDWRE